ncbi:MAG: aminopeptidase P family protein [Actinobacteria bacterium]|nr:aminopeptidase P family protein [Actinomycetota bacterium]
MKFDLKLPKADVSKKIPKKEYEERVVRLQDEMDRRNIDLGIAYSSPIVPGDVFYLSGYDPHLEISAAIIISRTKMIVIGGPESVEYARESMQAGEWRYLKEFQLSWENYPQAEFSTLKEVIDEAVRGRGIKRVGFLTTEDVISAQWLELVKSSIKENVEFVDASDILAEARYIKSKNEQELIRIANEISAEAIKVMIQVIKPGMRELEVAAYGDYVCKSMGAYNYGYDTLVTSGERINTIIGRSGNKVIKEGEVCIFGACARYEGYCGAPSRTIVVGGANRKQAEFLDHGLRVHEAALEKYAFGKPARDLDIAAREMHATAGFAGYQMYSSGHGTGISEAFEGRAATRFSDYNFPKNIVTMVDIGLYGHPEFYGFRHEEAYLINNDGITEKLTDLPLKVYERG